MSAARELLDAYVATATSDAATGLAALTTEEAAGVLAEIDPVTAAALLQEMPFAAAGRCLAALEGEAISRIAHELPIEILANLVRRLDEDRPAVLDALGQDLAEPVGRLLTHPPDTAGAVMDPFVTAVQASAPAGDVRASLRREPGRPAEYIYAVSPEQVLVGVVEVAGLFAADPQAPVSSVTRPTIDWVRVEMPLEAVEAHPGWQQYDVLPVVDAHQRLVGLIRHRRLRQLDRDGAVSRHDDHGVRTLVALGEVYWLGLSGLLQGLAAAATATAVRPGAGRPQKEE